MQVEIYYHGTFSRKQLPTFGSKKYNYKWTPILDI